MENTRQNNHNDYVFEEYDYVWSMSDTISLRFFRKIFTKSSPFSFYLNFFSKTFIISRQTFLSCKIFVSKVMDENIIKCSWQILIYYFRCNKQKQMVYLEWLVVEIRNLFCWVFGTLWNIIEKVDILKN